jgi:NADH-quinone oxidoreductase subunit C
MSGAEIAEKLRDRFGEKIGDFSDAAGDPFVCVEPDAIAEVCGHLKSDEELAFDALSSLSGVDYPKNGTIEVVYHLYSYRHRHMVVLKVNANRDDPVVQTVSEVWRAANWHEREVFDLLGVHFEGHPDLRRLLMPEDWPGHPLRKDFVEPEEYHGIQTSRESLIKSKAEQ